MVGRGPLLRDRWLRLRNLECFFRNCLVVDDVFEFKRDQIVCLFAENDFIDGVERRTEMDGDFLEEHLEGGGKRREFDGMVIDDVDGEIFFQREQGAVPPL